MQINNINNNKNIQNKNKGNSTRLHWTELYIQFPVRMKMHLIYRKIP